MSHVGSERSGGSTGASRLKAAATALSIALVVFLGGLFLGPFAFDEGPAWHASVVALRDAIRDITVGEPHVLVIGDPGAAAEQSAQLERQLAARGLRVRYTGDGSMSAWERKYVAVYWSIVGMVFDPPTG